MKRIGLTALGLIMACNVHAEVKIALSGMYNDTYCQIPTGAIGSDVLHVQATGFVDTGVDKGYCRAEFKDVPEIVISHLAEHAEHYPNRWEVNLTNEDYTEDYRDWFCAMTDGRRVTHKVVNWEAKYVYKKGKLTITLACWR